jgi:hypothetical protein
MNEANFGRAISGTLASVSFQSQAKDAGFTAFFDQNT